MSNHEIPNIVGIHTSEEIQEPEAIEKEFSIEELREIKSPRKIKFLINNQEIIFNIVNLSEKKKYGTKSSEKIDDNKGKCRTASLSIRDNYVFLASTPFKGQGKMTKKEQAEGMNEKIINKTLHSGIKKGSVSVDEDGDYVHKKTLDYFNEEGNKLDIIPSSLFSANNLDPIKLETIIDINDALDHDVKARYVLFPEKEGADSDFRESLFELESEDNSKYLALQFNYYPSYKPMDGFLQLIEENGEEYILMNVGKKNETKYFGKGTSIGDLMEIDEDFDFDLSI